MTPALLVVVGNKVVFADGVRPAALVVRGGRFEAVLRPQDAPKGAPRLDAGDSVVMPGLVDSHVHVNEPGRAEWEGFETATRAAAAGGVTTIVDMPLNSVPVTTTLGALEAKREAARGKLRVDCGFWGGVVPGNADELAKMAEAGICGFKTFLIDSGIAEFPASTESDLRKAMPVLKKAGVPLLAHAELSCSAAGGNGASPRAYKRYLASRPDRWERDAAALLWQLCRDTECAVHIVHRATTDGDIWIEKAKRECLPMTAETCPHYLTFAAEDIPDGRTEFKCAPPIRSATNRENLWWALSSGLLDMVVSDHSPCPPSLKLPEEGDFLNAWGGISSLQVSLAAVWTGSRHRSTPLEVVSRWMSRAPAELAGLAGRKGSIAPGLDADLVVWDPDAEFLVEPAMIEHRHKVTPYAGMRLKGRVRKTLLRGEIVYEEGAFPGSLRGELLERH